MQPFLRYRPENSSKFKDWVCMCALAAATPLLTLSVGWLMGVYPHAKFENDRQNRFRAIAW